MEAMEASNALASNPLAEQAAGLTGPEIAGPTPRHRTVGVRVGEVAQQHEVAPLRLDGPGALRGGHVLRLLGARLRRNGERA